MTPGVTQMVIQSAGMEAKATNTAIMAGFQPLGHKLKQKT